MHTDSDPIQCVCNIC